MTFETARVVRALGVTAAALGFAAIFAGNPSRTHRGNVDVDALARAVAHEDDHVTAIELAAWIKARRPGLRIVDIRSASEFDQYHVPTAERISIDSLSQAHFRSDETIVLYSEGGAHAAQAWVFLRALGYEHVVFLREGLYEWLDQVMNPTLAAGASPKDSARFADVAELSRYFGGQPQRGAKSVIDEALPVPAARANGAAATQAGAAKATSALATKVRRRGC